MAYPEKYTRQYGFQNYQEANPTRPLPGDKVDADLNFVERSIDEIVDFLMGVTRSDGALANASVGLDQLTPGVLALFGLEDIILGDASSISFAPVGSIAATDVQTAIAEVAVDYIAAIAAEAALRTAADDLKANIASPEFTGVPLAPTAAPGTDTDQIATTAFVTATVGTDPATEIAAGIVELATLAEVLAGTDAVRAVTPAGVAAAVQVEEDARVAADALKANLVSPVFTGTPVAPSAAFGTNTTQLATTAFVQAAVVGTPTIAATNVTFAAGGSIAATDVQTAIAEVATDYIAAVALKANIASPTFTGVPAAPTAAVSTNTTQLATTAFVLAAGIRTLKSFGAVGDGVADDSAAVVAALAVGKPLTGNGLTYGVSGDIILPANVVIEDATFKQLDPDDPNRRTLSATSVDNITLRRVKVDRNGDGTGGSGTAAGVYISGGSGHLLEEVEVFGDDIGAGILTFSILRSAIKNCYIHDINYLLVADPGDDQVTGIATLGPDAEDIAVLNNRVERIGGDFGAGPTFQYSRGFSFGGITKGEAIGNWSEDVDQGMDFTGSPNITSMIVSHNHVENCRGVGFKLANFMRDFVISSNIARNTGWAGFIFSNTGTVPEVTERVIVSDCMSFNAGYNGVSSGGSLDPCGFLVLGDSGLGDNYPRGIKFDNCLAVDDQTVPTMVYGFRCMVTPENVQDNLSFNEAFNCRSVRHTTKAFLGFHAPVVSVKRTAVQSIGNNAWTPVEWTAEDLDGMNMHSLVSNTDRITIRRSGVYSISGQVSFDANTTGFRGIRATVGGAPLIPAATFNAFSSTAFVHTVPMPSIRRYFKAGDSIGMEVIQNSGAGLDMRHQESYFSVVEVGPYGMSD